MLVDREDYELNYDLVLFDVWLYSIAPSKHYRICLWTQRRITNVNIRINLRPDVDASKTIFFFKWE